MEWLGYLVVGAGTAGILALTWKSLKSWKLHGFFRFFAFEAIFVLVAMNLDVWFLAPLKAYQIVSWVFLVSSTVMAIHGFYLLNVVGRPSDGSQETGLLKIEQTTTLVTVGAYRYIRHPLYCSLLLLTWGVFLKNMTLVGCMTALVATGFLMATALVEEKENLKRFGEDYAEYMKATTMFIPKVL